MFGRGGPVVLRPIPISSPEFQDQVVDECRDIEPLSHILIMGVLGQVVVTGVIEKSVPGGRVTVSNATHGHNIPRLVTSVPLLAEGIFDMFAWIEVAFVFAVDKKVGHRPAACDLPHVFMQASD